MQKKVWYDEDAMPLFLLDDLLIEIWWFDEEIARKLHFRCVN